jgi:GTP 3',8-cyclase
MRCRYCMAEDMQFLPKAQRLSTDEIITIGHRLIDRGITKIRLTGGEPLVHPDIVPIAEALGSRLNSGLEELTLSSNGARLTEFAEPLFAAGIKRVNISLDTLDAAAFADVTRGGKLADVLMGIAEAKAAGMAIKINMVALAQLNKDMLLPMLRWCTDNGHDLTIIEWMPVGDIDRAMAEQFIALDDFLAPIGRIAALQPIGHKSGGPARYYAHPDYPGIKIGLISALSNNFCASCNRIRISVDGRIYPCLGHEEFIDLRAALRGTDPQAFDTEIDRALLRKPLRHDFSVGAAAPSFAVARHMSVTGG